MGYLKVQVRLPVGVVEVDHHPNIRRFHRLDCSSRIGQLEREPALGLIEIAPHHRSYHRIVVE